jgi:cytochrome c-type biogenesis protein CcmH/NrfF
MMGSYIGAVTAFAVNQLGPRVPQAMQIFVWVGPAMVLVPMIVIWKGYYRRKFAKKPAVETDGSAVTLMNSAGS